jgi:hypothetical protein
MASKIPLGLLALNLAACTSNQGGPPPPYGTEADHFRVGGACRVDADCPQSDATSFVQECLLEFAGGYCGIRDCTDNDDCPLGSACVAHDNGSTYCFRQCRDKPECNANRPRSAEANCSANVTFTDPRTQSKACVPPSSG